MLLTFTCTKPIELADASKVKLTDAEGHAVELKGIENEGNVYTIEFDERKMCSRMYGKISSSSEFIKNVRL